MKAAINEDKQQGALRTIGEVSATMGVATHVLRFWESRFPQIKPQKRRGRRYYSPEDIDTIKTIKELLYDQGYTIRGVHKFLKLKKKEAANAPSELSYDNQQAVIAETQIGGFSGDLFANLNSSSDSADSSTCSDDSGSSLIIENQDVNIPDEKMAKLKEIYLGLRDSKNKLTKLA